MSRWRALAAVHDTPDAELRDRLVDALETLLYVADLLEVSPREGAIVPALEELKGAADHSNEIIELQGDLAEAEGRLESVDRLEAERDSLKAELDDARARLAAAQPLIDAYSDAVTFARRFVSVASSAGIQLRPIRAVRGRAANANGTPKAKKKI